jgi:regulator of sigma E protease
MVVILAGVTMNALFAWLVFTFLAAKNGRQIDPVTTVGRVVEELVPPEAEAFKRIMPGQRIVSVNGRPVASWDEISQGIANTPEPEIRLAMADGSVVTAAIHQDALEQRLKASQALQPFRSPVVGQVVPGRPAARAGIQPGDTIVSVAGRPVTQWYDLLELLQKSGGKPIAVEVARGGRRMSYEITPYVDSVAGPNGKPQAIGRIGVALGGDFRSEPLSLGEAVVEGWHGTVGASTQIVRTVRGLFSGRISKREVGGPILIGQLAGESARMGLDTFLAFMALISINLAVLNLLPVPVLDGGQFLFLLAEAVVRRPLPIKLRERLTMVGLVLIVLLMGLAFSNDIRRIFGA